MSHLPKSHISVPVYLSS